MPFHRFPLLLNPFSAQALPRQRFCSGKPEEFWQLATVSFFNQTWI